MEIGMNIEPTRWVGTGVGGEMDGLAASITSRRPGRQLL